MITRMSFATILNRLAINRAAQSVLFGSIAFVALTGGEILNPRNLDWLMIGDSAQHQIGWEFFRHTSLWQWPIGLNPALGLVFSSSIVFTDSIPLAAFFFKPFSPFLGDHFQYFGIWILLCFVLQYHFAHRILSGFFSDQLSISISSLFFVVSPPFLYRMIHGGHGHIALVSHFLILAAIDQYFDKRSRNSIWIIILCSGLLIQAYFMPMLTAIWLASVVGRFLPRPIRFKQLALEIIAALGAVLVVTWAAGYFAVGRSINPEGWNYVFRWQPLSLVDSGTDGSVGWSRIVRDNAQLAGDTEGFSYLGSGLLALAVFVAIKTMWLLLKSRSRFFQIFGYSMPLFFSISILLIRGSSGVRTLLSLLVLGALGLLVLEYLYGCFRKSNGPSLRGHLPLISAATFLALYSLTNNVGVGTDRLFEYPLPPGLKQFTETFRTHGRFIWPAFYCLMILVLIGVMRQLGPRWRSVVLSAALLFQLADSSTALNGVRDRFANTPKWESRLDDALWVDLASKYSSILVIPPLNNDPEDLWLDFTKLASDNEMSINSGYFSRYNENSYVSETNRLMTSIEDGTIDRDAFIVILDSAYFSEVKYRHENSGYLFKNIDGFNVVLP
jgi:hypothetical protein